MLILPAVDLFDGKVVRLKKGDFNQITYYNFSPIEIAELYEEHGLKWIHIVDLEASKSGNISVGEIIEQIKENTSLCIEFGGGVRNLDQVRKLIELGVDKIIIGSLSIENKNEFQKIIENVGADKIIAAIDSLNEEIKTRGWTEESGVSIYEHIEYCLAKNVDTFLCTDIQRDGMLTGPSTDLYKKIMQRFEAIKLIASGGISCIEDVEELKQNSLYAAVVGKAIYENKIQLKELALIGD